VAARLLSAQLDIAQVNDSALDRELYAVVAVIRHFGYMLEGRSFVIFTNHKPLVGVLSRCSDPWTARQQRQLSFIAKFSPCIRHIAGSPTWWPTLSPSQLAIFSAPFSPQQSADNYIAACSSPVEADKLSLCAQTISAPVHHLLFRCLRLRCKILPF
jgi:hypothetical protein